MKDARNHTSHGLRNPHVRLSILRDLADFTSPDHWGLVWRDPEGAWGHGHLFFDAVNDLFAAIGDDFLEASRQPPYDDGLGDVFYTDEESEACRRFLVALETVLKQTDSKRDDIIDAVLAHGDWAAVVEAADAARRVMTAESYRRFRPAA